MHKEAIYYLSEKLIAICAEREVEYIADLISNGTLLDVETAKRLADDCKVMRANLTIDGMGETHNKRRILVSGGDSYDTIMKNIEDCAEVLNTVVRINVDKDNADEIENFTKYLIDEKKWLLNPSFYLAFVDDYAESCLIDKSTCVPIEQIAEMSHRYERAVYASNRNTVTGTFFPRRKATYCGGECTLSYVAVYRNT